MREPSLHKPKRSSGAMSRLANLFRTYPWFGFIGSIASIVSIPLAVYFYVQSSRDRELTYVINPARAVVVKAGQTSRLQVLREGRPLYSDVTAIQVAFWNDGEESIRPEHMLEPFVIRVGPGQELIEATVRKRSRRVVQIALRETQDSVAVAWNILEEKDGGVVQLIVVGKPEAAVTATAVVEGQGTTINASKEWMRNRAVTVPWVLALIATFATDIFRARRSELRIWRMAAALTNIVLVVSSAAVLYQIAFAQRSIAPPFGF